MMMGKTFDADAFFVYLGMEKSGNRNKECDNSPSIFPFINVCP